MPSQVTVLLADDEDVVRQAIGELLETDPRFRVVASVGSAEAATRAPRVSGSPSSPSSTCGCPAAATPRSPESGGIRPAPS